MPERSGGCAARQTRRCARYESGVRFCMIVHEGGTIECWQQPELPAWEVPKRDPHERRPRAPDYWGAGGGGGDC
jgi:hypothetical protein